MTKPFFPLLWLVILWSFQQEVKTLVTTEDSFFRPSFFLEPALFSSRFPAFHQTSWPHIVGFISCLFSLIFAHFFFYPCALCSLRKPFCEKPAVKRHFMNKSDLTKKITLQRSVKEATFYTFLETCPKDASDSCILHPELPLVNNAEKLN